jgi:long-chain acyl-CoA synthetase
LAHLIEDSESDLVITADLALLMDKMEKMLHETRLEKIVLCPFLDILPFPKNILFKLFKGKDLAQVPADKRVVQLRDVMANDGQVDIPAVDAHEDVAVLQYTGGTTGVPKGAMLTHYNIYANTKQCMAWFYDTKVAEQRMMGVLPFFHVFAMTTVMNMSVLAALEIVALPRFDLKDALKAIDTKKPHFFPAVPAIYSAMNASPLRKKHDLRSLKYCISGGAPLPVEVKKKFESETGCVVIEGYGLSESSPVATANPVEGLNKPGSIGLPFPGTVIEIVDPEDKKTLMPTGERGEICIRGPQVMKGYWNKPEATADVLRDTGEGDQRLHTGDIGIMDEEGYVFIVDRLKDMVITNGYNVYPRNVEEAIYQHPNVEECIVAGIPDRSRGEIVKVWIKLKDGRELTVEDLKAFLKERISPMEIPKRYEFRDEPLPKTMIGKLSKKDVLAQEKSSGP